MAPGPPDPPRAEPGDGRARGPRSGRVSRWANTPPGRAAFPRRGGPPLAPGCPHGADTRLPRTAPRPRRGCGVERVQTECLAMKKVFTTGQVAKICKVAP